MLELSDLQPAFGQRDPGLIERDSPQPSVGDESLRLLHDLERSFGPPLVEVTTSRYRRARGLRAYLLTGDRDSTRDQVRHLYGDLLAGAVPAKLDVVSNLEHEFPDDFPDRLCSAVGFILDA